MSTIEAITEENGKLISANDALRRKLKMKSESANVWKRKCGFLQSRQSALERQNEEMRKSISRWRRKFSEELEGRRNLANELAKLEDKVSFLARGMWGGGEEKQLEAESEEKLANSVDGSAEFSFWGKKYEAVEKGRGRYERENQGGGEADEREGHEAEVGRRFKGLVSPSSETSEFSDFDSDDEEEGGDIQCTRRRFEGDTPPDQNRVEGEGDEGRGVVSPLPMNVDTKGGGGGGKCEGGSTPVGLREDGGGLARGFEATKAKVGSGTFDHFLVVGADVENRSERPHVYNNIIDEIAGNIKTKGIPSFFGLGGKKNVAKGKGQSVVKPTVLMHYAAKDGFKDLPSSPESIANFCFPRGIKVKEVNVKESMSDVNAIFYGPHCKRGDGSFIFTFNDDTGLVDGQTNGSTLYGVCATQPRLVGSLEVPRVYCILTRIPHFELHFRVLWDVIAAQKIGRLPMEGGVGADKHGYDTLDFIKQTFIRYSTVNIDGGVGGECGGAGG